MKLKEVPLNSSISKFRVAILIVICLSLVLFLSLNVKAVLLSQVVVNETFESNSIINWSLGSGNIFTGAIYNFNSNYGADVYGDVFNTLSPHQNKTELNYSNRNLTLKAWIYSAQPIYAMSYPDLRLTNLTAQNFYGTMLTPTTLEIVKYDAGAYTTITNNSCSFTKYVWYLVEMNITKIDGYDIIDVFTRNNDGNSTCSLSRNTTASFTTTPLYLGTGGGCSGGSNCYSYYDDVTAIETREITAGYFKINAIDYFNNSIALQNFSANISGGYYTYIYGNQTNISCYQESANISNQTGIDGNCNLSYTGNYLINYWNNPSNLIDGNWGTNAILTSDLYYFYINYTMPNSLNINGTKWQYKIRAYGFLDILANYSFDNDINGYNCLNQTDNILKFRIKKHPYLSSQEAFCYNKTDWNLIYYNDESLIYEEAMIWNIPYLPIINQTFVGYQNSFNTTTGQIVTDINVSEGIISNVTISSDENGGYFNKTYLNYDTSGNLIATIFQAESNFIARDKVTNTSVPNPLFTANTQTGTKLFLRANQDININFSKTGYKNITRVFNVPPLYNGTDFIVYNATIHLTLRDGNDGIINNYNGYIYNSQYSYNESFNTTNGIVEINLTSPLNYSVDIDATNYTLISNQTIIVNTTNGTQNINIYTLFQNNLNITILNESDSSLITERVNILFTSTSLQISYNTNNGKLFITGIPPDFYEVKFTTPSNNFSERRYYATIDNRSSNTLTAYLPSSNYSVPIAIYLKNIRDDILSNATITIQKQFNTSFVTIAQKKTDATGLALFNLINGDRYKFIIDAVSQGYELREFEIDVYYVYSPYTFKLNINGTGEYNNSYQFVTFHYSPTITYLNDTAIYNLSITTYSNQSMLEYTALEINGVLVQNITGSPSGATASLPVLANSSIAEVYEVIYSFKVQGFQPVEIPISYYINQQQPFYQGNIIGILNQMKPNINTGWRAIISTFVALVVAILIAQLVGNPIVSAVASFIVLGIFAWLGWLSIPIVIFVVAISFMMFYFTRGGY